MGSCISLLTTNKNSLHHFVSTRIIPYPGEKVYLSTLFLCWVWKDDYHAIVSYIDEYDPLNLKSVNGNLRKTLDCVGRYKRTHNKPFLTPQEEDRYMTLICAKNNGTIGEYPVVKATHEDNVIEYLNDCKLL